MSNVFEKWNDAKLNIIYISQKIYQWIDIFGRIPQVPNVQGDALGLKQ